MNTKPDCLFCRIVAGEIPAREDSEDEELLAFHDIRPSAPVHFLVVPKVHLDNLYDADLAYQEVLGRLMGRLGQMARDQGLTDGFRVVVNNGRGGREGVNHLHEHVMGGPEPLVSGPRKQTE